MKRAYFILALAIIGLSACNNDRDNIKAFIPGTYTKEAKSEYSRANDTLTITPLGGNAYLIVQSTGYQSIKNGKPLSKHYKVHKLTGIYDPQKQVMDETTIGRIFIFSPEKKLLLVNSAEYRKVK